jgi:glycosyltransferase involved in cell wall biosynthesis
MKIAVNTRLLLKDNLDGIRWFTYETMKRITRDHPEVEFHFLFDRKPDSEFIFGDNVKSEVLWPQARHPFLYYLFFEHAVPRALKRLKPDLFVSPDGYMSLGTKVKTLDVIHDLNFEHYPEHLPPLFSRYYRHYFPRFAAKAHRLVTVSEFSKRDLIEHYGIEEGKIDVVYNGVNERFAPLNPEKVKEVRERYSKGRPYFLFVGSIHPRKNLLNQLLAFFSFRERVEGDLVFVVVGSDFYGGEEVRKQISRSPFGEDVIFLGKRNLDELLQIYGAAFALSYVSYFEGFGIPLLEAMRSGIPAITANTSSMPEIGGSAVISVAPDSVEDIAEAMVRLYRDEELRKSLIKRGLNRAREFTWDKTARGLWQSITRALD